MDINGKVVVVTGASSGIGEATARLAHERGARVVMVARRRDRLDALASDLPGSVALVLDVTDPDAPQQIADRSVEAFGPVDVLVNNAGAGMNVPVLDTEAADFRTILELNLVAPLRLMQALAPGMRERGEGSVINVSSGTTLMPILGVGAYAATKAALEQLSDVARAELEGTGVVVSTLLPSLTKTEFSQSLLAGEPRDPSAPKPDVPFEVQTAEYVAERILDTVASGENHVVLGYLGS